MCHECHVFPEIYLEHEIEYIRGVRKNVFVVGHKCNVCELCTAYRREYSTRPNEGKNYVKNKARELFKNYITISILQWNLSWRNNYE
jgi:hypothetical protein